MEQPSLEDLAIEAKRLPPKSAARQSALTELIEGIEKQLTPNKKQGLEADIYEEAMQELFLYICKNIDRYNPEKPVINWVRFILKRLKFHVFNFVTQKGEVISGDVTFTDEETGKTLLDIYQIPDINPLPSVELVNIIKEDPERLFQNKLFKNNPRANFRAIALMRLDQMPWQDIVNDLGIGNTTGPVSTFFQRCCVQFKPKFQEYLQGGY